MRHGLSASLVLASFVRQLNCRTGLPKSGVLKVRKEKLKADGEKLKADEAKLKARKEKLEIDVAKQKERAETAEAEVEYLRKQLAELQKSNK